MSTSDTDGACWLYRVCESCGAIRETSAHVCRLPVPHNDQDDDIGYSSSAR